MPEQIGELSSFVRLKLQQLFIIAINYSGHVSIHFFPSQFLNLQQFSSSLMTISRFYSVDECKFSVEIFKMAIFFFKSSLCNLPCTLWYMK